MNRSLCALVVTAAVAFAQKSDIGAVAGLGAIAASDVTTTGAVAFGAEFCGLCSGRFGVFAEYSHLETVANARTYGITRFDIVAGGLRMQSGRRVRPFFDIGVAHGVDSFRYLGGSDTHGNAGVVLAVGAAIRLKDRVYMRPQFRIYALRGVHVLAVGSAGVGLRF